MSILLTPELLRNPYPMYDQMRAGQPVAYMEAMKFWSVFGYDDVRTVLSDQARFSSGHGNEASAETAAQKSAQANSGFSLITTDPPRHTMLRSLVSRAFTPKAVAALEPRIEQIANELLAPYIQSGKIDLIRDFSYPLPVIVIAELLGIPSEDRDRFKHWSDEVVASANAVVGEVNPESQQALMEMHAYFREIIAKRRIHPQDDLISALLLAEEEQQQLSEHDILAFCSLLLVAGNETTTNLIGNAVLTLLEHPEQWDQLRQDPQLLPSTIEEVLRYRSPVQAMFRTAKEELEIGRQTIAAGSRIVAWIGSANRDEHKFMNAHTFDITRNPNPHIAFGHGIHFCLGAPLARLEAKVALRVILDRLPNLQRINQDLLQPARGFIVHGVESLPLRFHH
ncbi:cytochrome P450 [Paenibacillus sp. FSL H7-0331]|uniref:cytochrome P450 n=1 Tax=Paenibacillus sp. FSL H7-0331 TaxID=1920421 RepID=UPI00096FC910|nr:cytochrome P450 [Paenibacillus sp. FSL H7-0331]OMF19968.1 cytochrome [Paenibacillus sp. FSL H7-0331]